jgi:hypothetical protein
VKLFKKKQLLFKAGIMSEVGKTGLGYDIIQRSKFRNTRNMRMLSGLFIEHKPYTQVTPPVYTLRDWHYTRPTGEYLPSLYLLYMEMGDVTEYNFATTYLDGWEHWGMLCNSEFFKPYIARWREELALKIKAEALQRLQEVAKDPTSKNFTEVNKYLADMRWREKDSKGRPKQSDVDRAAKIIARDTKDLEEDYERVLGITDTVQGNA